MIDPTKVAFDIDGVIADTMALFIDIVRDEFKINSIRYEDITRYNLADCLDLEPATIEAAVTKILDGDYRSPLQPIPGATEVLTRLSHYRGSVLLVTARPYPGPLQHWLQTVLPVRPDAIDVVATGTHERKAEILLDHGISCFVEDRLETCYTLQPVGIVPVLFKQPWNREPHPFLEVGNWNELEALIQF